MIKSKSLALLAALLLGANVCFAQGYTFKTPLYGVAYYNEYNPVERLDEDIRLMKEAGVSVVRVAESSWGLFEPQENHFEFEWMDRIIDKMHKAGIKVIFGTPTYSIPAWMAERHPEVLSEKVDGSKSAYGIRQNMDITNPTYLFYCDRIIRKLMERYAQHPAVIGYQVDNEVEARSINNHDYFVGFRNYIKQQFNNDLEALRKEWGLNYWGMNIHTWEEFYKREGVTNPSYKVAWERWNRKSCADFLNWQVDIVKQYMRKDQFITHCFMTAFQNIDQVESFRQMQYPAINVYHEVQDRQDGQTIAYAGDYMRTVAKGNYLITETNAQAQGWNARGQFPPYDGQLRQNVYSHLASGANMVEYWHWATLHYGQETYWKGILGHDMQPNRVYYEMKKTAQELNKVGEQVVNLKKENKIAMLFSHDSHFGLEFMPYVNYENYPLNLVYQSLYYQNLECDILPCDKWTDFSKYKMLVIPPLYVASDSLLNAISDFVKNGGEVVMLYKSGYCNEHSAVRPVLAPGPLAEACGFTYQEYSTIGNLRLKENKLGANDNVVNSWFEFLKPTTAQPLAFIDHSFFGQWPCITENNFGKGWLTYVGARPSYELMGKLLARSASRAGVLPFEGKYQFPIILRSGMNDNKKKLHYLFNYSSKPQQLMFPYANSRSLLDGQSLATGSELTIEPWGVVIAEEK